jgi:glycosyltransferase involved in cell wall biosynthesis
MPYYYQHATLHINTSHNEVVPMATLEAAACGVPTIGTHVGTLVDYPTIGIIVENNDIVLANAITTLLQDKQHLAALSQSALVTVQREFTITHTATRVRELYQTIQR